MGVLDIGAGFGSEFVVAQDDGGEVEVVARIDGPYDDATWNSIMSSYGGNMGAYIIAKMPQIQQALHDNFNTHPGFAPITPGTPFTMDSFNTAMVEYIQMDVPAGQTYPRIRVVPYNG